MQRYEIISADCHVDLCCLPPDLFVANACPELRDRMPYVTDSPRGPVWVTVSHFMQSSGTRDGRWICLACSDSLGYVQGSRTKGALGA